MPGAKTKIYRNVVVFLSVLIILAVPVSQLYPRIYGAVMDDVDGAEALFAGGSAPPVNAAGADSADQAPQPSTGEPADADAGGGAGEGGGTSAERNSANGSNAPDAGKPGAPNGAFSPEGALMFEAAGVDAGQGRIRLIKPEQHELSLPGRFAAHNILYPNSALSVLNLVSALKTPFAAIQPELFATAFSGAMSNTGRILSENYELQSLIIKKDNTPKKPVYLTIDDGPSAMTRQYLDILEANGVRATFFVIGRNARLYPDRIREMREKGHAIANHSYTHNYDKLYKSATAFNSELQQWDKAISDILGEKYHSNIFRFPGGSTYKNAYKYKIELSKKGYSYYDWNCLNGDAQLKNKTEDLLYNYMVSTFKNQDEVILLMHDTNTKQTSVNMLERAVAFFTANGYEFRTLDEKE